MLLAYQRYRWGIGITTIYCLVLLSTQKCPSAKKKMFACKSSNHNLVEFNQITCQYF
jgi:hypothetical protein